MQGRKALNIEMAIQDDGSISDLKLVVSFVIAVQTKKPRVPRAVVIHLPEIDATSLLLFTTTIQRATHIQDPT